MYYDRRRRAVLCHAIAPTWLPLLARAKPASEPASMLGPGDALPGVSMSGLNGPDRLLSSYIGQPLIVNVWASWCGPCRAEAASMERLAWSEAGQRFVIIGVSTDDYRSRAEAWLRKSNATLSHFIDRDLVLERLLGANKIPTTVLFGANGIFVGRFYGAREWDSAESVKLLQTAFSRNGSRSK